MPQVDFEMFKEIWMAANPDADAGPGNEPQDIEFVNPVRSASPSASPRHGPSPTFEAGVPVFDVEGREGASALTRKISEDFLPGRMYGRAV